MCGIAGVLCLDGSPIDRGALKGMTDALAHRGPDEGAVLLLPAASGPGGPILGLGHRRLRVVDLTPAAAQPMRDPGERGALVYNGELYNTAELRRELLGLGFACRTRSDTEVVLLALLAWGEKALARFNGMFALAFWNRSEQRLILARDRFGEKPLYYARAGGRFLFASELGALVRHGEIPLEIDPQAVELYLTFGFIPAPWTIYRAVRKLPHASFLLAEPGGLIRIARYYRLEESLEGPPPARPVEAVRQALGEAVRRRLEADVPLGAFLSGGIDSAAVVALMRRYLPTVPRTFSMGIPDLTYFDESPRARATAQLLGTEHREIQVDPRRLMDEIPAALDAFDEPFADSSALASSIISRLARRQLTVALSGDGGDEVFGGYRLYRALAAQRWLGPIAAPARKVLGALLEPLPARHGGGGAGLARQARKLVDGLASDLAAAHAAWMSIGATAARRALRPEVRDEGLGQALIEDRYRRFGGGLARALAVEIDLPLPDDMLTKVDRTSMRHGLEVRAPFLDPELVELSLSLPATAHFSVFSGKRLLRRALRDLLPDEVLDRPKRGFEVPIGSWLSGPISALYNEIVSRPTLAALPGFDARVTSRWFALHQAHRGDYGPILWSLFVLCFWQQGQHVRQVRAAAEAKCAASRGTAIAMTRTGS